MKLLFPDPNIKLLRIRKAGNLSTHSGLRVALPRTCPPAKWLRAIQRERQHLEREITLVGLLFFCRELAS